MEIVSAKPFDNISVKNRFLTDSYVGNDHTVFFKLGRYALLYILESFGIKPLDKILCPAFCCNSSIEPIVRLGYDFVFIDITAHLNIDVDLLIQNISQNNCKAIILPDYFGLFDTTSEYIYIECKKRNVVVIKDCAHSYLSYLYGSKKHFCDAVILSLRKSVNLQYGGVAIINYKKISNNNIVQVSLLSKVKFEIIKWIEFFLIRVGVNIYGKNITSIKNILFKISIIKTDNVINLSQNIISGKESFYLMNKNFYSFKIASHRRMNFIKLKNLLSNIEIDLPTVDFEDKVPQVFPLFGNVELYRYLRNNGIGATMWPFEDIPSDIKYNIELYPNTNYFLNNLVCLPIHQSLTDKQIKIMSELIDKYVTIHK